MNNETQLRELIQSKYEEFGYTPDNQGIEDTLNQTIYVLKNNDPPAEDVIEEICLAKSCAAKSEPACNYFTNKYLDTIRKSVQYRIGELKLMSELKDRIDDVANYVLQCLLYGKDAEEKCHPAYTLEKFDRSKSSLKTFISNIIKPKKGKGIIGIYMYKEGLWTTKEESNILPLDEEYMEKRGILPPQTIEILNMSEEEMKKAVDKLFELCRPEDIEIVKCLAAMYEVRKISITVVEDQNFKTNYRVSFVEGNGDKGMMVKNASDRKFFQKEEVKFHICFVLGFQLKRDETGWMLKEEIFDRMFDEKTTLNPINKIIAEIQGDLSKEGFNKNMVEDNGLKTEYRLSTKPDLVSFDAENRYLRLWFFEIGYKNMTKENVRKKKKDALDRLRRIGGEEFYELFRED